jgi:hypothetical protein
MKISILLIVLLLGLAYAQTDIFAQYYQESRKIAQAMTLDQKIAQMTQLDIYAITN